MKTVKASFVFSEREAMARAIRWVVSDLKSVMSDSPEDTTDHGCDEPSIDVRLCIDADGWIFRTGDSSFDPYHSAVCAASCVTLDTDETKLLEELISDALDQCEESEL